MHFESLLLLSAGLAMDAFAVSVGNGISAKGSALQNALRCAAMFGLFQGLMPLLGYWAGHTLNRWMERAGPLVAMALLCAIGIKMIVEARKSGHDGTREPTRLTAALLLAQALATSIDAMAVGVGLGIIHTQLVLSVGIIAAVTFVCCFAGVFIGRRFGGIFRGKAELVGGALLVLMGVKIFLEHSGRYIFP